MKTGRTWGIAMGAAGGLVLSIVLARGEALADPEKPTLRFSLDGTVVGSLDRAALEARCDTRRVEVDDPYYGRRKAFLACPLRTVLILGFGEVVSTYADRNFFLRARDGYVKPAAGSRLLEDGGFLAFADAERARGDDPGWEPIDRRQVDPGPFYLVWSGPQQNDVHRYPWPYQLASIEVARFETEYPNTLPRGAPASSSVWEGFAIFRSECIACHAVNGEGGSVGPDLNVPQSIVEYRPAEQIKAFVRNPRTFRYTSMPAHLHLSNRQLDALVAYFEAMKTRKRDPGEGD